MSDTTLQEIQAFHKLARLRSSSGIRNDSLGIKAWRIAARNSRRDAANAREKLGLVRHPQAMAEKKMARHGSQNAS
jgi:hypothetical protein